MDTELKWKHREHIKQILKDDAHINPGLQGQAIIMHYENPDSSFRKTLWIFLYERNMFLSSPLLQHGLVIHGKAEPEVIYAFKSM